MDPESKKLLEETFRLSEENNKILKKMRQVQRWANLLRILYAVIILGIAVGAFYYLDPYLDGIINAYNSASSIEEDLTGGGFKEFIKRFKK